MSVVGSFVKFVDFWEGKLCAVEGEFDWSFTEKLVRLFQYYEVFRKEGNGRKKEKRREEQRKKKLAKEEKEKAKEEKEKAKEEKEREGGERGKETSRKQNETILEWLGEGFFVFFLFIFFFFIFCKYCCKKEKK